MPRTKTSTRSRTRTRTRLSFAQLLAVMSTKIKSKMLGQNGHFPFVSNALNNTQLWEHREGGGASRGVARIPLVTWAALAMCVCVRVCLPRIQLSPARILRAAKAGTRGRRRWASGRARERREGGCGGCSLNAHPYYHWGETRQERRAPNDAAGIVIFTKLRT